jgi:hypothetical protein
MCICTNEYGPADDSRDWGLIEPSERAGHDGHEEPMVDDPGHADRCKVRHGRSRNVGSEGGCDDGRVPAKIVLDTDVVV